MFGIYERNTLIGDITILNLRILNRSVEASRFGILDWKENDELGRLLI